MLRLGYKLMLSDVESVGKMASEIYFGDNEEEVSPLTNRVLCGIQNML